MSESSIIVALISAASTIIVGFMSVMGVVITNRKANAVIQQKLEISQAVTDTKIEELTHEVREHNEFAKRVPVIEQKIKDLKRQIDEIKRGSVN